MLYTTANSHLQFRYGALYVGFNVVQCTNGVNVPIYFVAVVIMLNNHILKFSSQSPAILCVVLVMCLKKLNVSVKVRLCTSHCHNCI